MATKRFSVRADWLDAAISSGCRIDSKGIRSSSYVYDASGKIVGAWLANADPRDHNEYGTLDIQAD